jgi:hypothetical protein
VDVGVTIYWTVPAVVLLGFVSVWLIVPPLPALAPVMPPVIGPKVQAKVPGTLELSVMFVLVLLQLDDVAALAAAEGVGFTVMVIV